MSEAPRSFVDGLYRLDATQIRRRLADAMAVARAGTDGDAVRRVEAELLRTSRWAIRHLDAAIAEAERPARTPAEDLAAAARHHEDPFPGC